MRSMGTLGVTICMMLAPLPVIADQMEDAKAAIMDRLKDPDSARFSDVKLKGDIVCGWVNAKTSAGGYAGKRLWMYTLERKNVVLDRGGEEILTRPTDAIVIALKDDTCK
jgi:hypothetical protein